MAEAPSPAFALCAQAPSPAVRERGKNCGSGAACRLGVFRVADVLAPGGALALLAGFRQSEMREQPVRRRAVPVHRVGRDVDDIAWVQHLRLLALEADAADPRQAIERLPDRVGVPGGAGPRGEGDDRAAETRWRVRGDHRVLKHDAGKGFGGAPLCRALTGAN